MDILYAGGVNNPMDSIEQCSYLPFPPTPRYATTAAAGFQECAALAALRSSGPPGGNFGLGMSPDAAQGQCVRLRPSPVADFDTDGEPGYASYRRHDGRAPQ
jgi:hypothetical protein